MLDDFRQSLGRVRAVGGNPVAYSLKYLLCVLLCFGYLLFGRDVKVTAAVMLATCLAVELINSLPPVEGTLCVAALALMLWLPLSAWAKLADERDRAREEEWEQEEIEEGAGL
jgi:hypothetical protein